MPSTCTSSETAVFEGYYLVKLYGQTCGRMRFRTVKVAEPGRPTRFISTHEQKTVIKRGNDLTASEEKETLVEDDAGRPLSLESWTKESAEVTTRKATVKPGEIEMLVTSSGHSNTVKIPYKDLFLFPHAENTLRAKKGFRPGTTYSYPVFWLELGQVKEAHAKVLRSEPAEYAGRKETCHVLEITGFVPGVTATIWCGDDGYWRKFTLDVNETEIVACRKDEWEKPIEAPQVDAIARNTLDPGFLLPVPSRVREALFRLRLERGEMGAIAWADERQEVLPGADAQSIGLRVKREALDEAKAPSLPLTPEVQARLKEFLAPTPMLQCDDPAIQRTARNAAGGEKNALKVAKKLERFVFDQIKKKGYGTGMASAREVQSRREGDCTEHSVWLAALLRAAGIPSKISTGLTFADGVFVYHMWTEAWLGRWTALDATLCEPAVDPFHIEIADSPLDGAGPGEKVLNSAQVFGRLKLEVESLVLDDGKAWSAAELRASPRVEIGRFEDPALGISFAVPADCLVIRRGEKDAEGRDLPRATVALLHEPGKPFRIAVSNQRTAWPDDAKALSKIWKLARRTVPGGHALIDSSAPLKPVAYAVLPGGFFKIELNEPSAEGARAVGHIAAGIRLGGAKESPANP